MDLNYYQGSPCEVAPKGLCRNPTLIERLEEQKQDLTQRLARVNEALVALKEHPEVSKVLELVSKV